MGCYKKCISRDFTYIELIATLQRTYFLVEGFTSEEESFKRTRIRKHALVSKLLCILKTYCQQSQVDTDENPIYIRKFITLSYANIFLVASTKTSEDKTLNSESEKKFSSISLWKFKVFAGLALKHALRVRHICKYIGPAY